MLLSKKLLSKALVGALVSGSLLTGVAAAHGVWIAPRLDQQQLVLGEGYKDNAYSPDMVKSVEGYTKDYQPIAIPVTKFKDHITIQPTPNTSVAVVKFDYGYWTPDAQGQYHNVPMNQVPGATKGTHAIKYSVNYLAPVDKVEPIKDLPYQIVPLVDPLTLKVGDPLPIQVLHDGKPMPFAEIIPDLTNHHTIFQKTDKDGKAYVTVANGSTNVIGLELAVPYKEKSALATRDKIFSSLSFTIKPPEED